MVIIQILGNVNQTVCLLLYFVLYSSANATPAFEGRGGEHLAAELSRFLCLAHGPVFNLSKLCIVPGQSCWKLFVDVLILECGGKLASY